MEYSKLVEKIFEEEPSKLFVYLSLEDVKMNAKVLSSLRKYFFDLTHYSVFTSERGMEPTPSQAAMGIQIRRAMVYVAFFIHFFHRLTLLLGRKEWIRTRSSTFPGPS